MLLIWINLIQRVQLSCIAVAVQSTSPGNDCIYSTPEIATLLKFLNSNTFFSVSASSLYRGISYWSWKQGMLPAWEHAMLVTQIAVERAFSYKYLFKLLVLLPFYSSQDHTYNHLELRITVNAEYFEIRQRKAWSFPWALANICFIGIMLGTSLDQIFSWLLLFTIALSRLFTHMDDILPCYLHNSRL